MSTFAEMLAVARAAISEVDSGTAANALSAGAILLDVRERNETNSGVIGGSILIPRGQLELQVESVLSDKQAAIVVMCAAGTRSALAAKTLTELGYTEAVSMIGGFDQWKADGRAWAKPDGLNDAELSRYGRHLSLPEVGEVGQRQLLDSKVLVVGAGGLGSPAIMYLAAAGVGTIGIVDGDFVDESNLQRQVIHSTPDIGRAKVDSAADSVRLMNPATDVRTYDRHLDAENALKIMAGYDVVIDGADNFAARYLVNDVSVKLGIPVVHGSIFRFEGQVSVFDPNEGPTYRDLLAEPPPPELAPNCAEAGVIGVLPGVIGSIQALEAIKLILGIGDSLSGRLLVFDALDLEFHTYKLTIDPDNLVTRANADRIQISAYDSSCRANLHP